MGDMATRELTGEAFTEAQLAYLNQAVTTVPGAMCGEPPKRDGWYPKLFFRQPDITKFDPTIADVHTQPRGGYLAHPLRTSLAAAAKPVGSGKARRAHAYDAELMHSAAPTLISMERRSIVPRRR